MVKNKFGGNRAKGMKRDVEQKNIMTTLDDECEKWGMISGKSLGGGRFIILCEDGSKFLGIMRNYVKKGTRLDDGTFVVISPWDFETKKDDKLAKCSIIALGNPSEQIKTGIRNRHNKGEVQKINADDIFNFGEEEEVDINEL